MPVDKFSNLSNKSNESSDIAKSIIDDLITATFMQITHKAQKLKSVALYHDILKQALQDILNVYDKPKPCNDHSHVIVAWKRDKPAKPSPPDSLIKNLL
jgi:hypothetical protein